jgi:RTX calcium-binding nonapeptide repeat (4 copies)
MGISWRVVSAVFVGSFTAATGVTAVLAADAERSAAHKRIVGTKTANVLRGTAQADFIDGRGGNDVLYGFGGNDRLIGGAGADRIFCGRGRDTASADGSDTVARDCEVVSGRPTPSPPSDVPEPLLGVWNRNITDGAVIGDDHRGVWSLSFDRSGLLVVKEPVGAHPPGSGHDTISTTFTANADGELIVGTGTGCALRGIYRWEIADPLLRIQMVADNCPPRARVVPGDWSR